MSAWTCAGVLCELVAGDMAGSMVLALSALHRSLLSEDRRRRQQTVQDHSGIPRQDPGTRAEAYSSEYIDSPAESYSLQSLLYDTPVRSDLETSTPQTTKSWCIKSSHPQPFATYPHTSIHYLASASIRENGLWNEYRRQGGEAEK
ncbi:hypothetical protein G7K_4508-t1 [Saitoella complicata NRRL Y-17804]|uniref:Uncharacterized protein n=1 Tax=Saitoella complicata (strain BCRC 22490 / CBS 7301 / JCM 7358 / NBRC 10748 / NRRL Y-17804) TaxID=698492 RepID=A0A0E9NL34_SAICN|nr:hypothetical protein G7K_4508-t1 [Saitoella complicata NRRL Y-17804]